MTGVQTCALPIYTVVSVVVVILLVVDRLVATTVEKLFEEQMDNLFQVAVTDSV